MQTCRPNGSITEIRENPRLAATMLLVVVISTCFHGCSVHYFDTKTGKEHLWGFGHLEMKATTPHEGVKSVVRGTELIGFTMGAVDQRPYLMLGWDHEQRLEILDTNTTLRLEWPNDSFFNIRVGTNVPMFFSPVSTNNQPRKPMEIHQ